MSSITKMALAAVAATALAGSAQAQLVSSYTDNHNDLLLGFTVPGSTGDLVIDLGSVSQTGVGSTTAISLNNNMGLTPAQLSAELTSLYGGMGGVSFGVVGGHYKNAGDNAIYATVAHGAPAPILGNAGLLMSAVNSVGHGLNDFASTPSNMGIVDPTQGYAYSWTEQIGLPTSQWQKNAYPNPDSTTPANFSGSVTEDLYGMVNGNENFLGTITLSADGSMTLVPEPSTFGLVALMGLGLAASRRLTRKSA